MPGEHNIEKFNPYHGPDGRFTGPDGYASFSANPNTKAGKAAIRREQKKNPLIGAAYGTKRSHGQIEQSKKDKQSVKHAKHLVSDYGIEDGKDIVDNIKNLYKEADRSGVIRIKENNKIGIKRAAYDTATEIATKAAERATYVDESSNEEYKKLRNFVRNTPVKISSYDKDNIVDFNDYRKRNFGNVRVSNDGISIDSFFQELSGEFPHLFDAGRTTNPADQMQSINDALTSLKPKPVKLSGQEKQSFIVSMRDDIIQGYIRSRPQLLMAKSFYEVLQESW